VIDVRVRHSAGEASWLLGAGDLGIHRNREEDAVVQTGGIEMRVGILKENLLHVTNQLYKQGIFVQIRWTRCNKTYNIQCCQHHALIRILPDEY
jgi:hypothetical protein